jgi:inward rectifier potassium channel
MLATRKRKRAGSAYPSPGDRPEVEFVGRGKDSWRDAYHFLLTMPLAMFFGVMAAWFLAINLVFATFYYFVGGIGAAPRDFPACFFFSVQTLNTIGYGVLAPKTLGANLVVTAEAFVGLFNLAIATGLLFARISRPTARVTFSRNAVVTDFEGEPTLMFRAANRRRNIIVEADVSVVLARDVTTAEGDVIRRFEELPTLRSKSTLFYLSWQVMHRISDESPLAGATAESLAAIHAEIVVVIKGLDETFAQTVHARTSYTPDRIVWGRRMSNILTRSPEGRMVLDYTHFHDID